jgi:serine/threonine protein phosphatase PrpC
MTVKRVTAAIEESVVNGWRVAGIVLGERGPARCQDRAALISVDGGLVVVVADGAGGVAGGSSAAEAVITAVSAAVEVHTHEFWTPAFWVEVLQDADVAMASKGVGGESTAVVVALGQDIVGASVGDSVAWIVGSSGLVDLTAQQKRRPLMGSGSAVPTAFGSLAGADAVVVASDGFAKYAARARISAAATNREPVQAVEALVDLARTRSGALQDDLALIFSWRR